MFDSLLIANRGEIACRIIKTARKMGLRTIAVYSDADDGALHTLMADEAVHIGPAAAGESYLRTDKILKAAQRTGATAIHPGYGFLSERPDLVKGCLEQGLVWVGPHLEAITSMGSKIEAKQIALEAGLPCIPGYSGKDQSDAALIGAAGEIGFPVMVKASAGGGGKGMRAVYDAVDLPAAIASAKTEAERAFGDGRLLIEKLVQNPRHVEVQLMGDKHGNLVHLFERDCSVQRNHQKILEEAPAPNLDEKTRRALWSTAISLGQRIAYDSAGTVEFVLDAETQGFYFLEMNTRLQVEHTVTEEITGLDLVEHQLRAAAGEVLQLQQEQILCNGHAIEARLTAEDAADNFRPDTGTVLRWHCDGSIRCDTGVQEGSSVGASYDSLIAKLIGHGPDRKTAQRKLVEGLERLEFTGLKSNRLFLRDAVASRRFGQGPATTEFLQQQWPGGWRSPERDTLSLAVLAHHLTRSGSSSPWQSLGGFRLLEATGQSARSTYVDLQAPEHRVTIEGRGDCFALATSSGTQKIQADLSSSGKLRVTRDGVRQTVNVLLEENKVHLWGPSIDATHETMLLGDFNAAHQSDSQTAPDRISASMPGLVVEVLTGVGEDIRAGETMLVMESMKLLMELKAPADGTVASVMAKPGETVEAGALLVQLNLSEEERV